MTTSDPLDRDMPTCQVCRQRSAIGVACSPLGAYTIAYCQQCADRCAEPRGDFEFLWEQNGNDQPEWIRELTTFDQGEYITWEQFVRRYHDTD